MVQDIKRTDIPAVELTTICESVNEISVCATPPSVTIGEENGPKFEPDTVNTIPPAVETPFAEVAEVTTGPA